MSAAPLEDSVEVVLDALQSVFHENESVIAQWTSTDVQRFCALSKSLLTSMLSKAPCHKRPREDGGDDAGHVHGPGCDHQHEGHDDTSNEVVDNASRLESADGLFRSLQRVRTQLKKLVPYGAIPETVVVPRYNPQFDPDVPAADVDLFLYDDDDIEALIESSKLSRQYCKDCKGTSIGDVQFISHSFSRDQLVYLFCYALPHVMLIGGDGGAAPTQRMAVSICDVGSRLGIVLASALFYANQVGCRRQKGSEQALPPLTYSSITGLEINPAFCAIQETLLAKIAPAAGRTPPPAVVQVKCLDAISDEGLAVLQQHDVIVLHNVFEWFEDEARQLGVWKKLRGALRRPGQLLIIVPTIEASIRHLADHFKTADASGGIASVDEFIASWVERCDMTSCLQDFVDERLSVPETQDCGEGDVFEEDAGDKDAREEVVELVSLINIYRVKG